MSDVIYVENDNGLNVILNELETEINPEGYIFVRNGEKEIDSYVQNILKPDLDVYSQNKQNDIENTLNTQVDDAVVQLNNFTNSECQTYISQTCQDKKNEIVQFAEQSQNAYASFVDEKNQEVENIVAQAAAAAESATSSKNAAASSATFASNYANNSKIWAEGTDAQVQALGGTHSSKGWAEEMDVNNFVHKTGNETIYGYKTFRNDNSMAKVFIQGNLGLSENPAISGGQAQLEFHDKNGEWEGIVGVERYTNGQRLLKFQLKDQDGAQNRIELVRDQNGVWYATCPTPSSVSDNSTKIATTAWVRQVAALKDLSNITKPYVTETYQNGASWYRVWSDGWCEQGGQCVISQAAWVTITFLKSFINTEYVATGGSKVLDSSYPNNPLNVSFRNYTTTSVQSAVNDDTTINKGTWTWRVCGYIS